MASAVILAGGRGSRMGAPKATMRFGAGTIIERIVAELRRGFADIVIVAAPLSEARPAIQAAGASTIHDDAAFEGPVGALARGLRAARSEIVFACSCDMPMIRMEVARMLCGKIRGRDAVIPEIGGRLQPLCAVYRRGCSRVLARMAARGDRRLTEIADQVDARFIGERELRAVDPELTSFINVNTPEDYARALRMIGEGG